MQQQHKSATGQPIPKDELWKSISTAHQTGKPVAQAPIEAHEATGITESTEQVPVNNSQTGNTGCTSTESMEVARSIENNTPAVAPHSLDRVQPLDEFPNMSPKGKPLSTIRNAQHLLDSYRVVARYNVITKRLLITVPGHYGTSDNADNVAMSKIVSLASLNRMPIGNLPEYVAVIGDQNQLNPVADWITSKNWDGVDRLQTLSDTLIHHEDYPKQLKETLIKRWLLSAVAAALKPTGFKARGVLTLQGPQSIGKTSWISALVPNQVLREICIKLDHHLDASSKDSLITAVGHWVVEIGELDSSFKKDIARLKGFLTSDKDKIRIPYARTNSEYPRRTVFCATVNDQNFLVDATGNSRWWTIPVIKVIYDHRIDMQQLWAQMAVEFNAGEQWWLTQEEEAMLEEHNKLHRSISVIAERVLSAIDLRRVGENGLRAMSPSELLIKLDIKNPSNTQCKECAAVLREYVGESKRINGINKWYVPFAQLSYSSSLSPSAAEPVNDDDQY